MKNRTHSVRVMTVVLALLALLMSPISAHAGGGTPPPTSETPVQTSTPAPVEAIPTESPTSESTHLPPTKPGIDLIPTKSEPGNPSEINTPTPDPLQTTSPDSTGKVTKPALMDVLQELPGETKVIVLGDNGKLLPLVSQTSAGIFAQSDPIWCPEGVAPGGAGCTSAYATLTDLLSNAGTYINSQNVNGVIWITSWNIADTNPITIDGANYTNWSNYTLTLQGGWSGINADTTIGSNSVFSNPITITNWNNGIIIQNIDAPAINLSQITSDQGTGISIANVNSDVNLDHIHVNGAAGTGLYVETTGFLTASNISSLDNFAVCGCAPQNYGNGATLIGLQGVTMTGTNVFNNNAQNGLDIYSYTNIEMSNVTANGNAYAGSVAISYWGNIRQQNITTNDNKVLGASVGSAYGDITLNDVMANNNFYAGLSVSTLGDISLNNVTAENNVFADGSGTGMAIYFANNVSFSGGSISDNYVGLYMYCVNNYTLDASSPTILNNTINILSDFDNSFCPMHPPPTPQPRTFIQTQGELFGLDCSKVEHRYVVRLANGDRGEIYCPVNGEASIDRVDNTILPKNLPAGYTYTSAFEVKILQRNNQPISVITEGGYIVASFVAPRSELESSYAILYWDEENSTWIPLKDLLLDQNGKPENFELYPSNADDKRRILSGVNLVKKNGESRIEVSTNFPGVFVLVQQ